MYSRDNIATVIARQTMSSKAYTDLAYSIAGFLLQEKKIHELSSIMRDVTAYRATHGCHEVTVVSAYPLDASTKKAVREIIKKRFTDATSLIINERVDQAIIGGLRIEYSGEELDLTVQSKLHKLKRLTASGRG